LRSRPAPAQIAECPLAAIAAADVAGYSRLVAADEEGTRARLKVYRRELIDPLIALRGGRIVKTTGDFMLIEFPSPVEAVRWAVGMQWGTIDRNRDVPNDKRISFRVGINLGDPIVDGENLYGDAVNVAALLGALADPGGICIAEGVRDQIGEFLPYVFEDIGERRVENSARPVRAFVLRPDAIAAPPRAGAAAAPVRAAPIDAETGAPRLSIVVLPLANLSGDPKQQYFADGITEDLTTDLSRIAGSFVISRNTAFTYKDKPVDAKRIGRELNVRYLLEGSVRRSGQQVRVDARLIDAETGGSIWAEGFDHDTSDLLALQDEVTSRIAIALDLAMVGAEAARPTDHPDAVDYILRGRAAYYSYQGSTREGFAEAVDLFAKALTVDPGSLDARALLAAALVGRAFEQMSDTAASDIERAERLADEVLAVSLRHPFARFARAQVLRVQGRYDAAIPEYEIAIARNHNWVAAIAALGLCRFLAGSIEEAIPAQELAIRLSPRDPRLANWYWRIGMVHLLQSRTGEAILCLEKARSINPALPGPRAWLASAYALVGDGERAASELAEARQRSGDGRYSSIARRQAVGDWSTPKLCALFEATYFAGLRKAGMPEE
jgi:TolB-like protein/class 3 adenylate cyclase/Tfp pilus assembly protein PilF